MRMNRLLVLAFLLLGVNPVFGIGSTVLVTQVIEAGELFSPPTGSVIRYVTSLGPELTIYESRLSSGALSGDLLQTPDLFGPFPIFLPPTAPALFSSDGVTPFPTTRLHHPRLVETATGFGLYVISDLPSGDVHFFHSTDHGATWIHEGSFAEGTVGGGSGLMGVIAVSDPAGAGGFAIRLYQQGSGSGGPLGISQSPPSAVGLEKYYLQTNPTPAVFSGLAPVEGFTPTGDVFTLPDGAYGLFFVPQSDSYLGFAESPNGFDWTITRGAENPVLSTSSNTLAPDPARADLTEVTLQATPNGFLGYFTGSVRGLGFASRSVGEITIEFVAEYLRGDCTLDGVLNVSDVFCQLEYLFRRTSPGCLDALDTSDDGALDIGDSIVLLSYLFAAGSAPAVPFPLCGEDPTSDTLSCYDVPASCP